MKTIYEEYCKSVCGHLKMSQKLCFTGSCHLKNFFDSHMTKIPQETMNAISSTIHSAKIEEAIKASRYGMTLKQLTLTGTMAEVIFNDAGLTPEEAAKARQVNADEVIVLTLFRIILTNPSVREIKIKCKYENQPEVFINTTRERAIKLVGIEGMASIKSNWNNIWDYFKPILRDQDFATKVRMYLNDLTQENPVQKGPQPPTGFMGRMFR